MVHRALIHQVMVHRDVVHHDALAHSASLHNSFSAVYKYFPTNPAELKKPKAKMYDAGFVYAVATRQTMLDIVKWYLKLGFLIFFGT